MGEVDYFRVRACVFASVRVRTACEPFIFTNSNPRVQIKPRYIFCLAQEKQKYEIMSNTFKSLDDVINLYCELYERYPGILAIVDGIRSPVSINTRESRHAWVKTHVNVDTRESKHENRNFRAELEILHFSLSMRIPFLEFPSLGGMCSG